MTMLARIAAACLAAAALAAPAQAARDAAPTQAAGPTGLKAFLLRVDEPARHEFPRTPAFSWSPVRGAQSYAFQLSTSKSFSSSGIVWSTTGLKIPAVSIPIALPWITGEPFSLYARVRGVVQGRATSWSVPYGFNMRWPRVPAPLFPSYPGLVRWTPIEGATAYEVWLFGAKFTFFTTTNVADEREFYTFHNSAFWTSTIRWRVRAVRTLYGQLPNGLPRVTVGPWSSIYTAYNPPFAVGDLEAVAAVSDVVSTAQDPQPHELTPGFAFTGNQRDWGMPWYTNRPVELFHVYTFTDKDCVNPVYVSAVVGSPAYAPRMNMTLKLPANLEDINKARASFLGYGDEGDVLMLDGRKVTATEAGGQLEPGTGIGSTGSSTGSDTSSGSSSSGSGSTGSGSATVDPSAAQTPKIDLWDAAWPNGGYYWTVVPVIANTVDVTPTSLTAAASIGAKTITVASAADLAAGDSIQVGSASTSEIVSITSISGNVLTLTTGLKFSHSIAEPVVKSSTIEYRDIQMPQDACQSGHLGGVLRFGKVSQPVVTSSGAPYVSGLTPKGRLVSAAKERPTFYGQPLVAWSPALGADEYEVQWSRVKYPWAPAGKAFTFSTTASLPLTPGKWYYRIRGIDFALPGKAPKMSWSDPTEIRISKPTFRIVK